MPTRLSQLPPYHPSAPPTTEPVPASVRRLDDLLNARIARATSDAALRAAWTEKVRIKRQLSSLPTDGVDACARALMRELLSNAA